LRVRIPLEALICFIYLFFFLVFCVVRERLLRRTDHLSTGVLPSFHVRYVRMYVCVCVCVCERERERSDATITLYTNNV